MSLPLLLQQPLGSNSCLPTCIRAVLSWHGLKVSAQSVSQWCMEEADGCVYDLALHGLRDEGFDVLEVEEEEILLALFAETDPEPVIIMVRNPYMAPDTDHAVVVHSVLQRGGLVQTLDYMDPRDGASHQDMDGSLLRWWNANGSRGFIIRP